MGKQCADVLDVIPETVVLAFDITGITDPKDAARIARSKEVSKAMEKALAEKGKELIKKHFDGKEVSEDDALDMLKGAGSKLLDNRKKDLEKRLKCAYENSPLGVWIDKNNWVLYVFVPLLVGAVAGAGTYMFVAKTGDTPAGWAASLASNQKFEVTKLGKITLSTNKIELQPSRTVISGQFYASADFEKVKIKIEVGAGSQYHEDTDQTYFAGVSPKLDMTHIFRKDLKLNYALGFSGLGTRMPGLGWVGNASTKFSYTGSGAASGLDLSIGGNLAYDRYGLRQYGGSAGAGYKWTGVKTPPVHLGLTGSASQYARPNDIMVNPKGAPATEYKVMLNLTVGVF